MMTWWVDFFFRWGTVYTVLSILINKDWTCLRHNWFSFSPTWVWSFVFWFFFVRLRSFLFLGHPWKPAMLQEKLLGPQGERKHLFTLWDFALHKEWGFRFSGHKSAIFLKSNTEIFPFQQQKLAGFHAKILHSYFAGRWWTTCLKVVFSNLCLLCLLFNFLLVWTACTIVKLIHGLVDGSIITILDNFILFDDKITIQMRYFLLFSPNYVIDERCCYKPISGICAQTASVLPLPNIWVFGCVTQWSE